MKMNVRFFLSVSILAVTFACSERNGDGVTTENETPAEGEFAGDVIESEKQKFGVETITSDLKNPWGIAFLPDGRILVTERSGEIRIVKDGKLLAEKVTGVPQVYAEGQGGLLDIQLHPDYASNGWIYLSYSKRGSGGAGTTVSRAKLDGNKLTNLEELFIAQPFAGTAHHFGSRIAFDGKGYMFISCGERGTMENAQTLANHHGKIIRLHDDGKVPTDNPFVNTTGAKPEIWSYGHRNPQGLIYDKENNLLIDHEHGPRGGDEINIVQPGKNYGWPKITYGINYDGTPITDKTSMPGMEQPIWYYVPSIAPCGMVKVTGDKYPGWKNNLLVGALALQHISRVEIENGKYVRHEKLLQDLARFRAIAQSPDGFIYAATESPGTLIKLVPIK
jgi:glucose/arabinose dehydrogenase